MFDFLWLLLAVWNLCLHSKKDIFPFDIFIFYLMHIRPGYFNWSVFLWFTALFSFSVCSSYFMVDHQLVSGVFCYVLQFFCLFGKWKILFLCKYTFEQDSRRPPFQPNSERKTTSSIFALWLSNISYLKIKTGSIYTILTKMKNFNKKRRSKNDFLFSFDELNFLPVVT